MPLDRWLSQAWYQVLRGGRMGGGIAALENLLPMAGGPAPAKVREIGYRLARFGAPARTVIQQLADVSEGVLEEGFRVGAVSRPQNAYVRGQLEAGRRGMGMLDDYVTMRRNRLGLVDDSIGEFMRRNNLTPDSPEWEDIRAGTHPLSGEVQGWFDWTRDLMSSSFTKPELARLRNRMPVYIDRAAVSKIPPQEFEARVGQWVANVQSDPSALAVIAEEMGVKNPTSQDIARFLTGLLGKGHSRELPVRLQGLTSSATGAVLRRAIDIPLEWRMAPYFEMVHGLHDEMLYAVEAATLGRSGRKFLALQNYLRGSLNSGDLEHLPVNLRQSADEAKQLLLVPSERVQGELADMLGQLAYAYTGRYPDRPFLNLFRGVASAGAITMMPFSAIPNMGQAISELVVRNFQPFAKGVLGATTGLAPEVAIQRARRMALLFGQAQSALSQLDVIHGFSTINEALARRGGTKVLTSLVDPGWWKAVAGGVQAEGWRGMRGAAEEFLRATGFVSVEDWLRRMSVGVSIPEEVRGLQAALRANPADPQALRRLAAYTFRDPADIQRFIQMQLPDDPNQIVKALWQAKPEDALRLHDFERVYFHGVGQTQFNYLPGDFPLLFADPLAGSLLVQFRRYSYAQATKVVGHVLNEASHGNWTPLMYMSAAVPTVGEGLRRLRNLVSQREVALLPGGQVIYQEEPKVVTTREAKGLLGSIVTPDARRQMENAMAMGIMGLYTDALLTMGEGKPLLMASWFTGIFPTEVFSLITKMAEAGYEIVTGGERHPLKEQYPKVQEATRQAIRTGVPFFGRLVSPHVRWGRSKYLQVRRFGMNAWTAGNLENFNKVQQALVENFGDPITIDEIADYVYRQTLRERGVAATPPQPGDPGYLAYQQILESETGRRPKIPATPEDLEEIERKAAERLQRFLTRGGL